VLDVATCPDCGAYLSDDHRCDGRSKRRRRAAIVAALGAIVGLIVPSVLWPGYRGHSWLIAAMMMVLGALIALSVWRAIPGTRYPPAR
jgi:peptidoglycan/LPS O-acetylase OafA/YrhL